MKHNGMRVPTRLLMAFVLVSACWSGPSASGCPNCKEALASQTGDASKLKDGYYYSILMMMGMPFTLLGTGAFCVVRAVRKGILPEF